MKRLLLAGGGHAHLHLLKTLAGRPWPGVEVILVSPHPRQIYSGMLPGWMAGHYHLAQCTAALGPLAAAAGVRFLVDRVVAVEAGQRRIRTASHGEIAYDVLSLDVGAGIDASPLADCGTRLLPIRPLEAFVADWQDFVEAACRRGRAHLAIVGGGAAGVELALAARYRLSREIGAAQHAVTLVTGGGLLPGHGAAIVDRVGAALSGHGVTVCSGYASGTPDGLRLDDGSNLAADAIIAATGVRPDGWLADSGLALAADGFIAVGDGQQSVSHPEVFAAGDVATRTDAPHAKSGVYAVRAGPVLAVNLQRALAGQAPLTYRPQRRSLYLLATGPRQAIVSWGGIAASGGWAWRWKDWIDRRFMRQYQQSA